MCPRSRLPRPLLPALLLAVLAAGRGAEGQQTLELGADDTWIEAAPTAPDTPEGQLAEARRALAGGDHTRAEYLAGQWIDDHANHPLLPDAYLVRGDALVARRHFYLALFDYEVIARSFAGSDVFVTALQREFDIARLFASGMRRRLWGMRIIKATDEAEELLIRIQERLPGSQLAEEAGMALGDFYFRRRQMGLAAEMYEIFVENFPRSEHIRKARKRLIYAHLASFKGPEFDAAGLHEAQARLEALKAVDPITAQQIGADALLTRIDESDAGKLLTTARWYFKIGDVIATELTLRRLLRQYPRSAAAAEGLRLVPSILPRLPESVRAEAPDYEALGAAAGPAGSAGR